MNSVITISNKQKIIARKADLFGFLLEEHGQDVTVEGDCIRLNSRPSVCVRENFPGYNDFSSDDSGNSIDFLVRHLGYKFIDAAVALCEFMENKTTPQKQQVRPEKKPFVLPEPVEGEPRQLYAYLTKTRMVSDSVTYSLLVQGLMFQEKEHNNIVFVNPEKTFLELRGTLTYGKPFHRVMYAKKDAFWWFKSQGLYSDATIAYICKSAIDAISLHCLHEYDGNFQHNALYCAVGGTSNVERINHIKAGMAAAGLSAVIAMGYDDAGMKCRAMHPDCEAITPILTDWNEDLKFKLINA